MSTIKHTPEPWRVVVKNDGFEALAVSSEGNVCGSWSLNRGAGPANIARIVACVNALAGIEDPEAFVQQAKASIAKDKFPFT